MIEKVTIEGLLIYQTLKYSEKGGMTNQEMEIEAEVPEANEEKNTKGVTAEEEDMIS